MARSKRAVAYSMPAVSSAGPSSPRSSVKAKVRSNLLRPLWTSRSSTVRPGRSGRAVSWFCRTTMTWKSGWWSRARTGLRLSTSRSKGTSWCAWAARSNSRTRSSSSRKVGLPERSVRRTSVLTKNPTRSSSASSVRPATGEPSGMSSPAPCRCSTVATAARSTMNRVLPDPLASSRSRVYSRGGTSKVWTAPLGSTVTGRGRSSGSSVSPGSPARAVCQWSSWRRSGLCGARPSPSTSRCQRV